MMAPLKLNWSAVYSKAYSETPDNAEIFLIGSHVASSGAATRRWEHNSDKDLAGYIDLSYNGKPVATAYWISWPEV